MRRGSLDDILTRKLGQQAKAGSVRPVLEEGDTVEALCSPSISEPKRFTEGVICCRNDDVDVSYDVKLNGGRVVHGVRPRDVRLVRKEVPSSQAPPAEPLQVGDRVEAK